MFVSLCVCRSRVAMHGRTLLLSCCISSIGDSVVVAAFLVSIPDLSNVSIFGLRRKSKYRRHAAMSSCAICSHSASFAKVVGSGGTNAMLQRWLVEMSTGIL